KRTSTSSTTSAGSRQFVEQGLCVCQVGGVEAFGEPAVDRCEQIAGFGSTALVAPQPGEAHGGPQFPELGLLLFGNAQGLAIQLLGGLGMPLPKEQLALVPVQLCREPALPCSFDDLQSLVQQGQTLFNLPCNLTCPGQEGDMMGHPQLRPSTAVSG